MIHIAICEDDRVMLEETSRIARLFALNNPHWDIAVSPFRSAFDLLECIEKKAVTFQICLLDILMPGMNGIELGRHIRKADDQAVIIFQTSAFEYALESFKVLPMQYLIKPVAEATLHTVLEKACLKVKQTEDDQILVRMKGGMACIQYHQIVFIEYMNHTITYHLTTGKTVTTMVLRESFTDCMAKFLQDPRFLKPHASFVLNMDHVHIMTTREFEMPGGKFVPISKRAYAQVRRQYMDYVLKRHGGIAQ